MTDTVFLDTNVWLDYFDADRAGNSSAMSLVSLCFDCDYAITSASLSMNDLFYLLQANEKRNLRQRGIEINEKTALIIKDQATACVTLATELGTMLSVGHNELRMARVLSKTHSDFEDNIVVATALKAKPMLFVTNDIELIKHAPLPAVSTVDAIAHIKALRKL